MEENKVEPTTETQEEVKEKEPKVTEKTYNVDQVQEMVRRRLAQERSQIYQKLGVEDLDIAVNAIKVQKEAEEKQKIQKGEFEEILKNKTQEWNKEKQNLESQLKDIKINKSLLSSASKNKAINPDQVVSLLQGQIQLNESGNVEILDSKGLPRYNSNGELLTTDELVQEFLTHNPHFVTATPSGSGSVSNVDRQELNKPFNLSDLDMNNPKDRQIYAKYRKEKMNQPFVINSKL
tara:strand:- start:97 stop:801 length:705 start_codon:yes stop_codon:yes gene_type:complete